MPDMIVTKKSTRKLPCMLSEDEVRLRGIDLANATKMHMDLQDDKKAAARRFKEQLDAVNEQMSELKDAVRHGVEQREVECEYKFDNYLGNVTITRMDTGEVVEKRLMTPKETQGRFEFDGPEDDR